MRLLAALNQEGKEFDGFNLCERWRFEGGEIVEDVRVVRELLFGTDEVWSAEFDHFCDVHLTIMLRKLRPIKAPVEAVAIIFHNW